MTAPRCTGRKTNGEPCLGWRVPGATVCRRHLPNPQARANAVVRAEVLRWQPGTPHEDPGDVLLRLVTQGWARACRLAVELERLVEENGGDLAAALVGDTMMPHPSGGEVKVGEYVRGLASQEAAERERVARWSAQAVAAGLATRQIELAERQGQLLADMIRAVMGDADLGLSAEQRAKVPAVMRRHLSVAS